MRAATQPAAAADVSLVREERQGHMPDARPEGIAL